QRGVARGTQVADTAWRNRGSRGCGRLRWTRRATARGYYGAGPRIDDVEERLGYTDLRLRRNGEGTLGFHPGVDVADADIAVQPDVAEDRFVIAEAQHHVSAVIALADVLDFARQEVGPGNDAGAL